MKVIGKDRTSCDVCNPIDEILARLDALERRASAIVAKVQGIAPDGEGNVTLPTSSSDTDPLHGRVDAFAMSSEVKEAADDAHAYAASIADDVVVINSEIVALNQAVEALQPAEIEAIKSAVQTLQTTVATLESTVATLNNSVAGKVSKSGDTMTGVLSITSTSGTPGLYLKHPSLDITTSPSSNCFLDQEYLDKNGKRFALIEGLAGGNGSTRQIGLMINSSRVSNNDSWSRLQLTHDGTAAYVTAPSWSPGTNDNSDKILTIKMANSLPSLVHTTGNESIAGAKTFKNDVTLNTEGFVPISIKSAIIDSTVSDSFMNQIVFKDKNDVIMGRFGVTNYDIKSVGITTNWNDTWYFLTLNKSSNGTVYAIAPTTPTNASGTEIATADWVLARINELATKNKLTGL